MGAAVSSRQRLDPCRGPRSPIQLQGPDFRVPRCWPGLRLPEVCGGALTRLTARVRPVSGAVESAAWTGGLVGGQDQPGLTPAAQSRSPHCGDPGVQDLRLQNREGLCPEPGGSAPPPGLFQTRAAVTLSSNARGQHGLREALAGGRSAASGPPSPRQGTGGRVTAPASCAKRPCPHVPVMSQPAAAAPASLAQERPSGHVQARPARTLGGPGELGKGQQWGPVLEGLVQDKGTPLPSTKTGAARGPECELRLVTGHARPHVHRQ